MSEFEKQLPGSEEEWHVNRESWAHHRARELPDLGTLSEVMACLTSTEPDVQPVGLSPFGALAVLHAILQEMQHQSQYHRRLPPEDLARFEKMLQRLEAMSKRSLQQSSLTNVSLPRTLELDAKAVLETAYFHLYAEQCAPSMDRLFCSESDSRVSAVVSLAQDLSKGPTNSSAGFRCIQLLTMMVDSGVVWTKKMMTGVPSLQFHVVASFRCCK